MEEDTFAIIVNIIIIITIIITIIIITIILIRIISNLFTMIIFDQAER